MLIWRNKKGLEGQIRVGRWPDADAAAVNRQSRDKNPAETTTAAEAIFATVTALLDRGEPGDLGRAASMAGSAVLMPYGDKSATLDRIPVKALPPFGAYELLSCMAMGGTKVRSIDLMVGYAAAIEEIKLRKWSSEQDAAGLIRWIELFAFSDRPTDMIAALDALPESARVPGWRFRGLLDPVAVMAGPEAPTLIRELLQRFPELADRYELSLALLKQPPTVLIDIVVDIANGKIGSQRGLEAMDHRLPEQVVQRLSPVDRDLVVKRFEKAPDGSGKAFLGKIIAAINDPALFLLLAQDQTGRAVLENGLHQTLEDLIYDKVSVNDSQTYYEVFRRDSSRLRAGLFSLTLVDTSVVAGFATRCLDIVDAIRDEGGALEIEPRHPDISTGAPWPQIAVPR